MEGDFAAVEGALRPLRGRLLTALGNHDGSWGQAGEKLYAFNFTPEALYSRLLRRALALPGARRAAITIWMTPGRRSGIWC